MLEMYHCGQICTVPPHRYIMFGYKCPNTVRAFIGYCTEATLTPLEVKVNHSKVQLYFEKTKLAGHLEGGKRANTVVYLLMCESLFNKSFTL